ncbi:MAG: glycosyltransferase family 4 protein [Alphaproteobacteria bacterium]|nr:glycosyltransferase family 4 protein [Alphaproteobacteria bacterium]MBV9862224.1 glycosyltransferase family 4 protein [Alphaproteobacteria bacterium]
MPKPEPFRTSGPLDRILIDEAVKLFEGSENTLGAILGVLGVPNEGRALDIGGAAYLGQESTRFLVEVFGSRVDVLRPPGRDLSEFERTFGEKARLLDGLPGIGTPPYDVVVLCPNAARIFADLRKLVSVQDYLVRAGGYLICHGILPERAGVPPYLQPPSAVAREFAAAFAFQDGLPVRLPTYLSNYRFLGSFPRKTRTRSYLAWYVLQKPARSRAAGGSQVKPDLSRRGPKRVAAAPVGAGGGIMRPPRPKTALAETAPSQARSAALRDPPPTPRHPAEKPCDLLRQVKRYGPPDLDPVLDDIALVPPPAALEALLAAHEFDGLMFVNNRFDHDGRVMRTAEAVLDFGRKPLLVGSNDTTDYAVAEVLAGVPLVLIPNHNRPIASSLRQRRLPLDIGPRYEIWLATSAVYLMQLLRRLRRGSRPFIVHSHDFRAAYACAGAIELLRRVESEAPPLKWLHDIHEFVREYGIIDPSLQALGCLWEDSLYREADALTTVSGDLADKIYRQHAIRRPPRVIYNSNRLAARHKYKGPKLREVIAVGDRPVLVHSGNIRPGRGVEYAIEALRQLEDAHLLLITGAKGDYLDGLLERAAQAGVRTRIHLHPLLPYDEVSGFIGEADVGLIPMEHYGNADVSLPNKLFDYIAAGLPVVSSDTGNILKLLRDWPIGRVFPARDVDALVAAIREVVAERPRYRAAIGSRPDILLSFAWETQVLKLFEIYRELETEPKPGHALVVPEY